MDKYIISLSFGNYLKADGGVDKAINEYQKIFNQKNIRYIHISPVVPEGKIKKIFEKNRVYTVLDNGKYEGFWDTYEVYCYINNMKLKGNECVGIHIHHTKKFDVAFIQKLIDNLGVPVFFFLHDYYSICDQPNLLFNGFKFCGSSKKKNIICEKCLYGNSVDEHIRNTVLILNSCKEVYVVSPSELTLKIWKKTFEDLIKNVKYLIIPHQCLIGKNEVFPKINERLKIGFIGRYGENKGKNQWEKVVAKVETEKLPYELYYLGFSDIPNNSVKKIDVKVDADSPNKMLEEMKNANINCAFMWSICPETYSYAYFEAFAANLFIITNQDSGNIAYLVNKNKNGRVYPDINKFLADIEEANKLMESVKLFVNSDIKGPKSFKSNENIANLYGKKYYSFQLFAEGQKINIIIKRVMEYFYLKKNRK